MQKKSQILRSIKKIILASLFLGLSMSANAAGLTWQGPTGFITVPSHKTIPEKQIDMAIHAKMYQVPNTNKEGWLNSMSFGFSPFRNLEFGIQKTMDTRHEAHDPDPTVNFKVALPPFGDGEFSQVAFGGVFDFNQNNYHTLYLTVGGFGVGWNFGGNPGGMASYGKFDKHKDEPKSLCLLFGVEMPGRKAGERGYKSQYYLDYNGDVTSIGWRLSSHRGFWVDAAFQTESSYDEFYDYKPFIFGLGANF